MATQDKFSKPVRDRRRFLRKPFQCRVGVVVDGRFGYEESMEIGEGGMLLTCRRQLRRGDHLELHFPLLEPDAAGAWAEVVYIRPTETDGVQIGVRFTHLDGPTRQRIRDYIAELETV